MPASFGWGSALRSRVWVQPSAFGEVRHYQPVAVGADLDTELIRVLGIDNLQNLTKRGLPIHFGTAGDNGR